MAIHLMTIDAKEQRYPTVGDWYKDEHGDIIIAVTDMNNPDYEFLVQLHELVEWYLCQRRGITQDQVDKFDNSWDSDRYDEPGDDPTAPYYKEHCFAYGIEYLMATELGINLYDYDDAVKEADKNAGGN